MSHPLITEHNNQLLILQVTRTVKIAHAGSLFQFRTCFVRVLSCKNGITLLTPNSLLRIYGHIFYLFDILPPPTSITRWTPIFFLMWMSGLTCTYLD